MTMLTTTAVRPDHSRAPVSLEVGPIRPRAASTVVLVVVRQLDEHRPDPAAELVTLRARVKTLQTAIATARTVALVIDEDALIKEVANTSTLSSGWAPAQLLGRSPLDFVHPDDKAHAAAALTRAMKAPGPHPPTVVKALTRGGSAIWVESALTNALDDPQVRGIVASFSDVTGQTRDLRGRSSGDPELLGRMRFRRRLQGGLRELDFTRDLRLAYQPIVELATSRVIAHEALLRWHHPKLGVVRPDDFVPIAEASGQIVAIGRWVLSQACLDAVQSTGSSISVNVSSRQLSLPTFVDDVVQALDHSGLPPHRLVLEVTETAVLDDWQSAAALLRQLSARGVRIAIDDFGTGYATLKHFKQLPVDIVKIDRSFVAGLGSDGGDTAIVTSVVQLAAALGTEVVAEGVETAAQRDLLISLGCSHGQGWLFGKPTELS
ncbi:MAG: EAL domain-containing protein [Acidothermaceae bacterium]